MIQEEKDMFLVMYAIVMGNLAPLEIAEYFKEMNLPELSLLRMTRALKLAGNRKLIKDDYDSPDKVYPTLEGEEEVLKQFCKSLNLTT